MANVIKNDKGFKVISMSIYEAEAIGFGINYFGEIVFVCDKCGEYINVDTYYVAVLNKCLCPNCYYEWYIHAKRRDNIYHSDTAFENRHFEETFNALMENNIPIKNKDWVCNASMPYKDVMYEYKIISAIRRIDYGNTYYYCGYVGVAQEYADLLPLAYISTVSMEHDEAMLDDFVDVHGGITFSGKFTDTTPIIPVTRIPPYYHKYHWYGFDLNRHDDVVGEISNNFEYCKKEVLSLMEQIKKLIAERLLKTNNSN